MAHKLLNIAARIPCPIFFNDKGSAPGNCVVQVAVSGCLCIRYQRKNLGCLVNRINGDQ